MTLNSEEAGSSICSLASSSSIVLAASAGTWVGVRVRVRVGAGLVWRAPPHRPGSLGGHLAHSLTHSLTHLAPLDALRELGDERLLIVLLESKLLLDVLELFHEHVPGLGLGLGVGSGPLPDALSFSMSMYRRCLADILSTVALALALALTLALALALAPALSYEHVPPLVGRHLVLHLLRDLALQLGQLELLLELRVCMHVPRGSQEHVRQTEVVR